jgi:peptide/nickel transport system permease protein
MGFGTYITKRLIVALGLLFVVTTLNFAIVHLAPGGPEAVLLSNPRLTVEARTAIIKSLGLDKPLYEQYIAYVRGMLTGDWGTSYFYLEPAFKVVAGRVPATLLLMVPSITLTILIGVALGILAARRPYSLLDRALSSVAFFFYAMPAFWLGFLLLTVFSLYLAVLPASGMTSVTGVGFNPIDYLRHLLLPMLTLTLVNVANFSLLVRSSLIEVLDQNYIMTARGKGLTERTIFYRHALRNGLLPTVTMIGLYVGFILAGAILTETVFSWPGLGLLTFDSIFRRDYPIVLALFFIFSAMVIVANLVTDIVYGLLDPRISYE